MTASRIQVGASQDFLNTNKVTTSAGEVHNEIVELYSFQSTSNTSTDALDADATYTGTFERNDQPQVMASCQTDAAGTLYFDFSVDGTNFSTFPVAGFAVAAGIHEFHIAVKGPRWFRARLVNGSATQTYLRLYTYFGTFGLGNAPLNQSLGADSDAITTRSVLMGATDGGTYKNVPVTPEGHLEVAIHNPLLPFGSLHTEKLTPVFQTDFVYGINTDQIIQTTGLSVDPGPAIGANSGAVTAANAMATCSTGTTAYSFASLQSRRRLRYRAGQGVVGYFTAMWSEPVASSIVVAGYGTGEAGYYFGYNGTSFGVLHSTDGVREIQTFTVTNQTTTGGTVTFRLNGLDTQVTLTALATPTLTANEIATKTFPGWDVEARGADVVFLANSVGNKTGTFSITLGTAVGTAGTFAETVAGAAAVDTWIPQESWNGDVCDGTGSTGFTLDHQKGNLFRINVAYLGFGPVTFSIMVPNMDGNNAAWVTVHTINNPNARTTPHVKQPSFPFTMAAYSSGSTTDVSVSTSSIAGFIEGDVVLTGPRSSFYATSQAVTTGSYHTLFSVRNDLIHRHGAVDPKANQSVVNILSFGGAHDDATPIQFFLIRNATLVGPVNWTEFSADSCMFIDKGATTCTIANEQQIVQSLPIGQGGTFILELEDTTTLQPGETLTVAATAVTGTSTWTIGTLNTREDQ